MISKEITKRYARSCNRKCEMILDYNARRYNSSRIFAWAVISHLHYKVNLTTSD